MGPQARIFVESEATAWLERNKDKLPVKGDPVLDALSTLDLKPDSVLEVGCANGWRLAEIYKRYKCKCSGIDPCVKQFHLAFNDTVALYPGTADMLPFRNGKFDLLIYGFCLYLCDPEDYFKIVMEGDRVLRADGYLVVYDFHSAFPRTRPYEHKSGILTRKMDFSTLWSVHPAYNRVSSTLIGDIEGDNCTAVHILQKRTA